jgi:hypothetical protein
MNILGGIFGKPEQHKAKPKQTQNTSSLEMTYGLDKNGEVSLLVKKKDKNGEALYKVNSRLNYQA